MKEEVLVSVVIPCYNSEKFINVSIESILNQRYKNIEIIIVDDGSEDNTLNESEKLLKDLHNKKILPKKNEGVSAARNLGLQNCTGKYVFFLDSDDFVHENYIECMVNTCEKLNLNMCFCGVNKVDEYKNVIERYVDKYSFIDEKNSSYEVFKLHMENKIMLWTGNIIYKVDFLKDNKILFATDKFYGEDQEFILKSLILSNNIGCLSRTFAFYTIRRNSIMHTFNKKRFTGINAFMDLKQFLIKKGYNSEIINLTNKRIAFELYYICDCYIKSTYCDEKSGKYFRGKYFINIFLKYGRHLNRREYLIVLSFIINKRIFTYFCKLRICCKIIN